MSLNPRDYDLDELRKMARERGGNAGEGGDPDIGLGSVAGSTEPPSTEGSLRQGLYRELLPLQAGADAEKPYLHALPQEYAGEQLVFEWLEFLLEHAGYQGAREALSYYESLGWLTEHAESRLEEYLRGLETVGGGDPASLDVDDHLLSLVYIAKLSAMA